MDIQLIISVVMLAGWALWTFLGDAPGWAHIFLSLGFFLLIYRIVAIGTPGFPKGGHSAKSNTKSSKGGNK